MTNALMTTNVEFEVNGEMVKLSGNTVKQYLVRGNGSVSDQELVMFMNLCKFQKLNPFLNEAYLIKFGSSPAQIIVSKEAFMKRAENHPKYEGFEAGIIVERNGEMVDIEGAVTLSNDILIGGWAKIYRSDRKKPITTRISLKEFSKGQATWKDMPLNMIRKSAIVNAQREAFPETLGALYTEDDALTKTGPKDVTPVQPTLSNAEPSKPSSDLSQAFQQDMEAVDAEFTEYVADEAVEGDPIAQTNG